MNIGARHPGAPISTLPATTLGWWAVGLSAAFGGLILTATIVPRGAGLGFLLGLAGGIAGLTAILRDGERAVLVLATFLPVVIAVAFVVAELGGGA